VNCIWRAFGPQPYRTEWQRAREFQKFHDTIVANVPATLDVQLILDPYGTRQTALIRRWLLKRPCFQARFTPKNNSSSAESGFKRGENYATA
jgi:hypothetical protein